MIGWLGSDIGGKDRLESLNFDCNIDDANEVSNNIDDNIEY